MLSCQIVFLLWSLVPVPTFGRCFELPIPKLTCLKTQNLRRAGLQIRSGCHGIRKELQRAGFLDEQCEHVGVSKNRLPQHLMLDYHIPIRIAVEVRAYPMFQSLQVALSLIIS